MEVLIHKESWDKIINYAKAAYVTEKAEIGGMAVVTQDEDGDWTIKNPVILPQEIAGTTCDLDKEDLAKYYTDFVGGIVITQWMLSGVVQIYLVLMNMVKVSLTYHLHLLLI